VGVLAGCTVLRVGSTAPVDRVVVVTPVDRVGLRSTGQRVVAVLTVDGQRDGSRGRGARGPRTTHRVVAATGVDHEGLDARRSRDVVVPVAVEVDDARPTDL